MFTTFTLPCQQTIFKQQNPFQAAPPRPRNAWIIYLNESIDKYNEIKDTLPPHQLLEGPNCRVKAAAMKWRELTPAQKRPYWALAEKEKMMHEQQYPGYKYSPRRGSGSDGHQSRNHVATSTPVAPVPISGIHNFFLEPISNSETTNLMETEFSFSAQQPEDLTPTSDSSRTSSFGTEWRPSLEADSSPSPPSSEHTNDHDTDVEIRSGPSYTLPDSRVERGPPDGVPHRQQQAIQAAEVQDALQIPPLCVRRAQWRGVEVDQFVVNGVTVMRRCDDFWVSGNQILKVAEVPESERKSILLEIRNRGDEHEIVRGSQEYSGTWLPLDRGRAIAKHYGILHLLMPLFDPDCLFKPQRGERRQERWGEQVRVAGGLEDLRLEQQDSSAPPRKYSFVVETFRGAPPPPVKRSTRPRIVPTPITLAFYAGPGEGEVDECIVRGVKIMRRRGDCFVNCTQILRLAQLDEEEKVALAQRMLLGEHEVVVGTHAEFAGTWIPLARGRKLAQDCGVLSLLLPILDHVSGVSPTLFEGHGMQQSFAGPCRVFLPAETPEKQSPAAEILTPIAAETEEAHGASPLGGIAFQWEVDYADVD